MKNLDREKLMPPEETEFASHPKAQEAWYSFLASEYPRSILILDLSPQNCVAVNLHYYTTWL